MTARDTLMRAREAAATAAPFLMTLGLGFIVFGFIYFSNYDDAPPFAASAARITDANGNEQTAFRPGDVFYVHREFCSFRKGPSITGRSILNTDRDVTYQLTPSFSMLSLGCAPLPGLALQIPPYALSGRYQFRALIQFPNNPFYTSGTFLPPGYFEVVP